MNTRRHQQMQQARRRIARNRRSLERNALRLSHTLQSSLDWRMQSQRRPIPMLLGAMGVGMIASRLLSAAGSRKGWEQWLFDLATSKMSGRFWKQLAEAFMGQGNPSNEEASHGKDET